MGSSGFTFRYGNDVIRNRDHRSRLVGCWALNGFNCEREVMEIELAKKLAALDDDSVVTINFGGPWTLSVQQVFSAANLRKLVSAKMNVGLHGFKRGLSHRA